MPDELDRLLNEALASYGAVEPRPGLEQRVWNRVRMEAAPRRRFLLWWAVPVAAAACLVAVVALWPHRAALPEPPPVERIAQSTPPPAIAAVEAPQPVRKVRRSGRAVARRGELPKQQVFPTPAPLTDGERAVLAFARTSPDDARRMFAVTPPAEVEPIRIDKLELQPLHIGDSAQ